MFVNRFSCRFFNCGNPGGFSLTLSDAIIKDIEGGKIMKKTLAFVIAVLIVNMVVFFMVAGCSSGPYIMKNPKDSNASLVFGYFDMSDAPCRLGWIQLRQLNTDKKDPTEVFAVSNGIFYDEMIIPGLYRFDVFVGSSGRTIYYFPMPQGKNEWDPVIEKPGIHFVGSYKYKKSEHTPLQSGHFSIVKINTPTEKEILEKLLAYAGDTVWVNKIKERIKEIGE
jgi:hypothetical protein